MVSTHVLIEQVPDEVSSIKLNMQSVNDETHVIWSPERSTLLCIYLSVCDLPDPKSSTFYNTTHTHADSLTFVSDHPTPYTDLFLSTKEKYNPVAKKVHPAIGELPEKFRIEREIIDINDTHLQEMKHSLDVDGDDKIPTTTSQIISPNRALLSLAIYPPSFYHFLLSNISPYIPKTRYCHILRRARPLLHGSQGYGVKLSLTLLLSFSLLSYKDKDILENGLKNIVLYKMVYYSLFLLFLPILLYLSCNTPKS
jgi:hypothetical protein